MRQEHPDHLVVALDPVNFEKPSTKKLEGVSTVDKCTPPNLEGKARLAHGYPFDQEQGLDVEDLRDHTLGRMRRIFALVLVAAQFVFHLMRRWPLKAVLWLRKLGGKFGLTTDRDGPNILLHGLSAVWLTVATLSWTAFQPFPYHLFQET